MDIRYSTFDIGSHVISCLREWELCLNLYDVWKWDMDMDNEKGTWIYATPLIWSGANDMSHEAFWCEVLPLTSIVHDIGKTAQHQDSYFISRLNISHEQKISFWFFPTTFQVLWFWLPTCISKVGVSRQSFAFIKVEMRVNHINTIYINLTHRIQSWIIKLLCKIKKYLPKIIRIFIIYMRINNHNLHVYNWKWNGVFLDLKFQPTIIIVYPKRGMSIIGVSGTFYLQQPKELI